MTKALASKHEIFVKAYLADPKRNGTKAAIKAGYSKKSAHAEASRLLKNVKVAAILAENQAKIAAKLDITAERVVAELALLGFCNMQDYMRVGPSGDPVLHFGQLTRDQAAALAEVTVDAFTDGGGGNEPREVKRVKFKLADKRAALVDLGRHLGLFKDRIETSGPGGGPIQTEDVTSVRDELARRIAGTASRIRT